MFPITVHKLFFILYYCMCMCFWHIYIYAMKWKLRTIYINFLWCIPIVYYFLNLLFFFCPITSDRWWWYNICRPSETQMQIKAMKNVTKKIILLNVDSILYFCISLCNIVRSKLGQCERRPAKSNKYTVFYSAGKIIYIVWVPVSLLIKYALVYVRIAHHPIERPKANTAISTYKLYGNVPLSAASHRILFVYSVIKVSTPVINRTTIIIVISCR